MRIARTRCVLEIALIRALVRLTREILWTGHPIPFSAAIFVAWGDGTTNSQNQWRCSRAIGLMVIPTTSLHRTERFHPAQLFLRFRDSGVGSDRYARQRRRVRAAETPDVELRRTRDATALRDTLIEAPARILRASRPEPSRMGLTVPVASCMTRRA